MIGISLPFATWIVAANVFHISRMNIWWAVLVALVVTTGIFRLFNNYAADGFARSYANSGTWEYLVSRFGVEERPVGIDSKDIYSGPSQLDRQDMAFMSEVGISDVGLYVNINALGRIFVPWESVSFLKKQRISTETGTQQMVSLAIDGPAVGLSIPWSNRLDEAVPKSVGIG